MSSDRQGKRFIEWIGFRSKIIFDRADFLGKIFGALIVIASIAVILGGFAALIQFLIAIFRFDIEHEAIRNLGLVVLAVIGAPFVLWRALVAQKQVDTAEQSHITDQINKAVSGLGAQRTIDRIGRPVTIYTGESREVTHRNDSEGPLRSRELRRYHDVSRDPETEDAFEGIHVDYQVWSDEKTIIEWQDAPVALSDGEIIARRGDWAVFSETVPNIEVRIGAIYALERISHDSPRDHIQIMEILTAYIRENSPALGLKPRIVPFVRPQVRTDIQAGLDVIGRRSQSNIDLEKSFRYRLNLKRTNLAGASLFRGKFEGAIFNGSNFEAAILREGQFSAAKFGGCLLNFTDFFNSHLDGAVFDGAIINQLDTWNGSITAAKSMRGVSLAGADISALNYLPTDSNRTPSFGTKDTKLSSYLEDKRQKLSEDISEYSFNLNGIHIAEIEEIKIRLSNSGFLYWSPFESSDGATGSLRRKMWDSIGLAGFPFTD